MNERYYCESCPGHNQFSGTALVYQGWIVDEDGEWVETETECSDVAHEPDDLYCTNCGEGAEWGVPPSPLEQLAKAAPDKAAPNEV